jgi:hypothetical protein
MRRAPAQQGGAQRQCVKSAQQLIQAVQVVLKPLPQRFLATIKVVQFSAVAVQVVRRRLAQPSSGLPEVVPLRGQALRSVVLSMGRSYARSDSAAMCSDEGGLDNDASSST